MRGRSYPIYACSGCIRSIKARGRPPLIMTIPNHDLKMGSLVVNLWIEINSITSGCHVIFTEFVVTTSLMVCGKTVTVFFSNYSENVDIILPSPSHMYCKCFTCILWLSRFKSYVNIRGQGPYWERFVIDKSKADQINTLTYRILQI